MSLLGDFFKSLFGIKDEKKQADLPCSNCPSGCSIAPEACEVCKPYKTQLLDVLYYADDIDAFRARYEVVGESASSGTYECPYCGAPSANPYTCEYCGMSIKEDNGKIRVARASDIPNPILQAQDIIWERYENIVDGYDDDESSGGLLSAIAELFTGSSYNSQGNPLGSKMSEEDIKEAAKLYGVKISEYLTGLDNGRYKTLKAKKQEDAYSSFTSSSSSFSNAGSGLGLGAATLGLFSMPTFTGSHNFSVQHYSVPHPNHVQNFSHLYSVQHNNGSAHHQSHSSHHYYSDSADSGVHAGQSPKPSQNHKPQGNSINLQVNTKPSHNNKPQNVIHLKDNNGREIK
ncbi:MAG: hypothetical protein IJL40_01120 [Oscillospiraceae bacterium]|nr:hypothetical protein [Oscillospiraceae bacterium]MBQ6214265.1 hypothetical protein [Oscillospiraceae bacterium]